MVYLDAPTSAGKKKKKNKNNVKMEGKRKEAKMGEGGGDIFIG